MRGAAAPRTPRLKRKDTLHAYRVAANATDFAHGALGEANYATCLFKKMVFDNENVLWLDLRSQMKP